MLRRRKERFGGAVGCGLVALFVGSQVAACGGSGTDTGAFGGDDSGDAGGVQVMWPDAPHAAERGSAAPTGTTTGATRPAVTRATAAAASAEGRPAPGANAEARGLATAGTARFARTAGATCAATAAAAAPARLAGTVTVTFRVADPKRRAPCAALHHAGTRTLLRDLTAARV
jgi:hypothetical protein